MNITYRGTIVGVILALVRAVATRGSYRLYDRYCHYRSLYKRQRTRDHLRHLSPEQLDDIGITPQQAQDEMKKGYGQ